MIKPGIKKGENSFCSPPPILVEIRKIQGSFGQKTVKKRIKFFGCKERAQKRKKGRFIIKAFA